MTDSGEQEKDVDFENMARSLRRPVFIVRFPFPFLLVGNPVEPESNEFKTRVGEPGVGQALQAMLAQRGENVPPVSVDTMKLRTIGEDFADAPPTAPGGPGAATGTGALVWRVHAVRKSRRNPYSDRISIGRARSCDIVLTGNLVSKLHAHILGSGDGTSWELRDADSANGCFVNGSRLARSTQVPIQVGDKLRFAGVEATFLDAGGIYDWYKPK